MGTHQARRLPRPTSERREDPDRTCRVRYSITSSARASSVGGTSRPHVDTPAVKSGFGKFISATLGGRIVAKGVGSTRLIGRSR
jgi:hypothetical protein